jgi:hypothetical protein
MNKTLENLKKTTISTDNFTWERQKAIDIIASMENIESKEALSKIALTAPFSWERVRALNYLKH